MNQAAPDSQAVIRSVLAHAGLIGAGETPRMDALTGGVSSDIWRIDLAKGPVCVKRALARLKVLVEQRERMAAAKSPAS